MSEIRKQGTQHHMVKELLNPEDYLESLLLENERLREDLQEAMNKVIANNSKIYKKFAEMVEGQKPCTK